MIHNNDFVELENITLYNNRFFTKRLTELKDQEITLAHCRKKLATLQNIVSPIDWDHYGFVQKVSHNLFNVLFIEMFQGESESSYSVLIYKAKIQRNHLVIINYYYMEKDRSKITYPIPYEGMFIRSDIIDTDIFKIKIQREKVYIDKTHILQEWFQHVTKTPNSSKVNMFLSKQFSEHVMIKYIKIWKVRMNTKKMQRIVYNIWLHKALTPPNGKLYLLYKKNFEQNIIIN